MTKLMTQKEWLEKQGIRYEHDGNGRVTKAWLEQKPSSKAK